MPPVIAFWKAKISKSEKPLTGNIAAGSGRNNNLDCLTNSKHEYPQKSLHNHVLGTTKVFSLAIVFFLLKSGLKLKKERMID